MPKQYKVIERSGWDGWEDCWKDGEKPARFNTIEEAEKGIRDFLDEEISTNKGLITMKENEYSREDFKIVTADTPEGLEVECSRYTTFKSSRLSGDKRSSAVIPYNQE